MIGDRAVTEGWGEDARVSCGDVGMCAEDTGDATVEIPAERDFF